MVFFRKDILIYGMDYSKFVFSIAKVDTIRVLFSILANKYWPLYQFDDKYTFLHGEIGD